MSTALLVDGQNLFMRSVFGARSSGMSSIDGISTGPLVLFINGLAKHVRTESPDRLLVVWDGGTSTVRQRLLPSYKASRRPVTTSEQAARSSSAELVRRFCAYAKVPMLQIMGVEADDLIAGAWAHLTLDDTDKISILSSDHDFLQLLGPNPHGVPTEQIRLSSAGTPTDRWDEQRFIDVNGYPPSRWPLVTALAGDSGDGVPGLAGIGPKKALKLLTAAEWDFERALEQHPAEADLARACLYCVDLRAIGVACAAVPVPVWRPTGPNSGLWGPMIEFLEAHDLRSIQDRVQSRALWSDHDVIAEPASGGLAGRMLRR
jgi:DNA polymerase-1